MNQPRVRITLGRRRPTTLRSATKPTFSFYPPPPRRSRMLTALLTVGQNALGNVIPERQANVGRVFSAAATKPKVCPARHPVQGEHKQMGVDAVGNGTDAFRFFDHLSNTTTIFLRALGHIAE